MAQGGNHAKKGPRAIPVELPTHGEVTIYGNAGVANALEELETDLDVYQGVRLGQLLEAAYEQGEKNGRRQVFENMDDLKEKPELKHRNPGRPPKKK